MNPKVTIVVPVYNASKYLHRCLNSLVNQTLKDIEIIIVDDNSTDHSANIVENFQKNNDNILLIREKANIGAGAIRNQGVKKARGKYLLFVDSDDWIDSNSCENLYKISEEYKLKLLIGRFKNTTSIDKELTCQDTIDLDVQVCDGITFLDKFNTNTAVWGKLWNLDFIKEHELKNVEGRTYEDLPMVVEGIIHCSRIGICNYTFYNYFIDNPDAITKKTANKKYLEDRLWLINYLSRLELLYRSNSIISNYISGLIANQIVPALYNLRTYNGKDKNTETMLLDKIEQLIRENKRFFLSEVKLNVFKKTYILISPKLYITTIRIIDKLRH